MRFEGYLIKNEKGQYYCENSDEDFYFDSSPRLACIFESFFDARNAVAGLKLEHCAIQKVVFTVEEIQDETRRENIVGN